MIENVGKFILIRRLLELVNFQNSTLYFIIVNIFIVFQLDSKINMLELQIEFYKLNPELLKKEHNLYDICSCRLREI